MGIPTRRTTPAPPTAPAQPQFAVHLTKTVTAHYQAGGEVTFVIQATNDGPSTAARRAHHRPAPRDDRGRVVDVRVRLHARVGHG